MGGRLWLPAVRCGPRLLRIFQEGALLAQAIFGKLEMLFHSDRRKWVMYSIEQMRGFTLHDSADTSHCLSYFTRARYSPAVTRWLS